MPFRSDARTSLVSLCRFLLFACVLFVVGPSVSPGIFAQANQQKPVSTPARPEAEGIDENDVISVTTSEVMLPVTVRKSDGQFVTTLTRDDFRVFEDGREQPLTEFTLRKVPADVVLMIDTSSSVVSYVDDFRHAVEAFALQLAPEDRISLIKFDDRVELLQDWTQSRFQLRRALNRVTPGMFTRFHDALFLASREQFAQGRGRRAVLVLTDGIDSGRGYTLETALRALLTAQVTVYVVSNTEIQRAKKRAELDTLLGQTESALRFNALHIDDLRLGLRALDISEQRLEQLTAATGGRLYKPESFARLDDVYREVADELRNQYALYYTPLDKTRDGRFRHVRVETSDPKLRTNTRVGYYAPRK